MSSGDNHDLAQWLADAARDLAAIQGSQATVDEICDRAVAVVAGCRSAVINEARRGQLGKTLAASDETARYLHAVQHEVGDGPCVSAIWQERIVWSDDLAEEQRWPRFARAAVDRGVRSLVAIQLYTDDGMLSALSLFSDVPGAFDEATRDVAQLFAEHAAVAAASARENAQLAEALTTRQRIGQATGILAERHGLTTDEAFTMLVRSSQNHNIKIRDLAARLVTSEDEARRQARTGTRTSQVPIDGHDVTRQPSD